MSEKPPKTSGRASGSQMRVPSGKMSTFSPRFKAAMARLMALVSAVPRLSGMAPTRAKNQETNLFSSSSLLYSGRLCSPLTPA